MDIGCAFQYELRCKCNYNVGIVADFEFASGITLNRKRKSKFKHKCWYIQLNTDEELTVALYSNPNVNAYANVMHVFALATLLCETTVSKSSQERILRVESRTPFFLITGGEILLPRYVFVYTVITRAILNETRPTIQPTRKRTWPMIKANDREVLYTSSHNYL